MGLELGAEGGGGAGVGVRGRGRGGARRDAYIDDYKTLISGGEQ